VESQRLPSPLNFLSFAEPTFTVTERDVDDGVTIFAVAGEIHVSTAPEFTGVLTAAIAAGRTRLVVDLADVVFIDSTGLSVLLNALRRVRRAGGAMTVVCTNPTVLRLFEITQLDSTFDLHDDVERALAQVQAATAGGSDAGMP
jgi:anti-sigma B factor antagonist